MRLPLVCAQCMQDDISTAMITATAEFLDEGPYEIQCPKGHRSFIILQQVRFEILFLIGAYAIRDGYYREAVSSFTASVERFYEFFIRAALIEHATPKYEIEAAWKHIPKDEIEAAWKHVSRQSERQLGAFIFLHLREFGVSPTLMSNADVQFRNDVVHRGRIPTRAEAIEYGEHIVTLVRPLIDLANKRFPEGVQQLVLSHMIAAKERAGDKPTATQSIGTILSLTRADQQPLEQQIAKLPRWEQQVGR